MGKGNTVRLISILMITYMVLFTVVPNAVFAKENHETEESVSASLRSPELKRAPVYEKKVFIKGGIFGGVDSYHISFKEDDTINAKYISDYLDKIKKVIVNDIVYEKSEDWNLKNNTYEKATGTFGSVLEIAINYGFSKKYYNSVKIEAEGYEDNYFTVINEDNEKPGPEFDDSQLNNINRANNWQIMTGEYIEKDGGGITTWSNDLAMRITKSVIPSGKENEFFMYINVEPQVTWKNIFALNTIVVSNSNKPIKPPEYPSTGKKTSTFLPEPKNGYTTPIKFEYYNGRELITSVTMYTDAKKVPNGSIGIGNPILKPDGGSLYAQNRFQIKNDTVKVDLSSYFNKKSFVKETTFPLYVSEYLGDNINVEAGESNSNHNGLKYKFDSYNKLIKWELPEKDLGILDYEVDDKGHILSDSVITETIGGKEHYFRKDAYRLIYKFTLDVTGENFKSADNGDKEDDISKVYAVAVNSSCKAAYKVGKNGRNKVMDLDSPYVKGLLYDMKFKKIIKGSLVPLDKVNFELREKNSEKAETKYGISNKDGNTFFEKIPCGSYSLDETKSSNLLINESLPKSLGTLEIGRTSNPDSLQYRKGKRPVHKLNEKGNIDNEVNTAEITVKKITEGNKSKEEPSFSLNMKGENIYSIPGKDDKSLKSIDKGFRLKSQESKTYRMIVPVNGGSVDVDEILSKEELKKWKFDRIEISDGRRFEKKKSGCRLKIYPEDKITVTVYNKPEIKAGRLYVKNFIQNYKGKLNNEETMINVEALTGKYSGTMAGMVLKHNETSGAVIARDKSIDNIYSINQIQDKNIKQIKITAFDNKTKKRIPVNGNCVSVKPDQDVLVVVYNKYVWKPFFHSFDFNVNRFERK